MRKYQKKTIENLIELLLNVNDDIQKALKNEKLAQAMDLLVQCQEGAIKVGTLIEESEGEGVSTVGLLEQYCEDLYHVYERLNQGQIEHTSKTPKMLRKQLIQIENSIKHDIKETIETVFLPYKASMWDSLESVWQAAEADENCDAYVVPIPYYDRNPDGSFKEMHYEGEQFPDYVPIIHYSEYNLEEHRPDMIYIHNPYDGQNLVTSVHPDFYSKKLKEFTEKLVYIPYFVLGEPDVENEESLEKITHFVIVPAVINADEVIVQSPNMRKAYIEVLTKAMGEETREIWKGKILGLGSPKLEKVKEAANEEILIPEDWKRVLYRSDGSRKKVILYNISVSSLLEHEDKMLTKIRSVLHTFKIMQEEAVLLWRPHPLIPATIKSMRPQLQEEYMELVDIYRREAWGIFDDTADLNRAISISDGYYGDPSSVVQLYQEIKKPVMIQNVDMDLAKGNLEYIVVQAGGRGTRLKHLTKNKPKALVPVENLPMLFHLFRKYPNKRFIIIADYKKEVLREYLESFADVQYQIVDASGTGTCSGIKQALKLIPKKHSFMLVWSDLILPHSWELPEEYTNESITLERDYIGISKDFPCRWSYKEHFFVEESSSEYGVAGLFLFRNKEVLNEIPESGELVRWMQQKGFFFEEISLTGTREFGLLEEYEKLEQEKCRPFNRIRVEGEMLIKEAVDTQGEKLAEKERLWYQQADTNNNEILPKIYAYAPLKMEYIKGKNIYECNLSHEEKKKVLATIVDALRQLHYSENREADYFSMKEAYYNKTMMRLDKIRDLVPFAGDKIITVNGKKCRNVYFHKRELEQRLEKLHCDRFHFIHGDCTFSNMMLREDGSPVLIDPRGYFGYTELYGDERYDWAKLYYSIVGNYDRFNLKRFTLNIGEKDVCLDIESNGWEDMENYFFSLTGVEPIEIKLLHAVIWLSLTTYAWQDYDSICGAFYNGLYYLEEVL